MVVVHLQHRQAGIVAEFGFAVGAVIAAVGAVRKVAGNCIDSSDSARIDSAAPERQSNVLDRDKEN